jgi:hypothetical protein
VVVAVPVVAATTRRQAVIRRAHVELPAMMVAVLMAVAAVAAVVAAVAVVGVVEVVAVVGAAAVTVVVPQVAACHRAAWRNMRHRHRSRNPTGRGVAVAVAAAVAEEVVEAVAPQSVVAAAVAAAAVAAGRSSKRGGRNRQPLVLREARIENRLGRDRAGGARRGDWVGFADWVNTGSAATIRPLPPHPSQPLWLSSCCRCGDQRRLPRAGLRLSGLVVSLCEIIATRERSYRG